MKTLKGILFLFLLVLLLTGCKENTTIKTIEKTTEPTSTEELSTSHVHEYAESIIDPGCEAVGYTVFACSCGDEYLVNYKEPYGHSWNKGTVIEEATCEKDGLIEFLCYADSSHKSSEIIPMLGHSEGDWVLSREKTCLEDGEMVKTCIRCDYVFDTKIIEKGHVTSEFVITKEPSCIEEGLEILYCDVCNEVIEENALAKLDHTYTGDLQIVKSICTANGFKKEYCSSCKVWIQIEEYEMIEHEKSSQIISINPTCTKTGTGYIKCVNCDKVLEKVTINSLGHDIIEFEGAVATCVSDGYESGFGCSRCDYTESGRELIPALGHDTTSSRLLTALGHSYDECTCSRCDYEYRDNLSTDYTKLYGYNYIKENYENGAVYAELYKDLYLATDEFMHSTKDYTPGESSFVIKKYYYNCTNEKCTKNHRKYQISKEEAAMVWRTFTYDNPQYMFLWNGYTYGEESCYYLIYKNTCGYINLVASKEYAKYEYRKETMRQLSILNSLIAQSIDTKKGPEYIAKDIHDFICNRIYYSYLEDGKTPDDSKNAHNMVGFIMDKKGVCECYAKTFEYYSYLYGLNSLIAVSENHMWNIIEFYGHWYGMDLTWDDGNTIKYTYFGASKSVMDSSESHKYNSSDFGIGYLTPFPELSNKSVIVSYTAITVPTYQESSSKNQEYIGC